MDEHITFDEMVEFISGKSITTEYMKLAARVNSHILKCKQCRADYQALLKADTALNSAAAYIPVSQRAKMKAVLGLYAFENNVRGVAVQLSECVRMLSELTNVVKFKIQSFTELMYEELTGTQEFYHPAFAAAQMSNSTSEEEDAQMGIMKSTLIDKDTNRITVSLDRRLSLYFNKSEAISGALIALIPTGSTGEPRFGYPTDYDDNKVVVRFTDVEPGEYIVACQE